MSLFFPYFTATEDMDDPEKIMPESVELSMYRLIIDKQLVSCFPNLEVCLRMFLSMMVTNCSGERSFSKLARIKSELRSSMNQIRMNNLALLSIEHELLREIDISSLIDEFSRKKCRKAPGLHH